MVEPRYSRYYVYIKPIIGNKYVQSFTPYIFSVLAIIIFTIFAIRPTLITIIELQKSIQDNQAVLNILDQKSKDLTLGITNLNNIDPAIKNKINARLPDNPAVTNLILSLQSSASKSASITALQVQPITIYNKASAQTTAVNLDEITFSFNTQASYSDLLSVIDNFSKSSRLINLISAVFNKTNEGGISLSVSGKSYYLKH